MLPSNDAHGSADAAVFPDAAAVPDDAEDVSVDPGPDTSGVPRLDVMSEVVFADGFEDAFEGGLEDSLGDSNADTLVAPGDAAVIPDAGGGDAGPGDAGAADAASGDLPEAAPLGCPGGKTCLRELPHARVNVHFHPHAGKQLTMAMVHSALADGVNSIELDLHCRAVPGGAPEVIANHDGPTAQSPRLADILDTVTLAVGADGSVQGDGLQFFVVLEPKSGDDVCGDPGLLDRVFETIAPYEASVATGVGPSDPARGITFVVTGALAGDLYDEYGASGLNRLAIVEGHDYANEIQPLSPGAFQWKAIEYGSVPGKINTAHQSGFNVRVWFSNGDEDKLRGALAAGADSLNCDFDEIGFCHELLHAQRPRGSAPTLAQVGQSTLLGWRGLSSNSLYVALGTPTAAGPVFSRQVNLGWLLADEPQALAPAVALLPDGRLLAAYEGTEAQRLWAVAGAFSSLDSFVTFHGGEQKLTLPNDAGRRGSNPGLAVASDGRTLMPYEGTSGQKLWYLSGSIDDDGTFSADEYSLTEGDSRRGYEPSAAFHPDGRVVVVYRGTAEDRLFYVTGVVNGAGELLGDEHKLTTNDDKRRGRQPSIAIAGSGRVVIAYEGTADDKLWLSHGTLDVAGALQGVQEAQIVDAAGTAVKGRSPAAAFDAANRLTVLYEGTADGKLWFVSGSLNASTGKIAGHETLLDMDLGNNAP